MTTPLSLEPVGIPGLTAAEFSDFRGLVAARLGIALGPHKADLVRARLIRRLCALRLASFRAYHDYLCDAVTGAEEWPHFVHAITTKKTEFFREAHHFAHLAGPWAEERRRAAAAGAPRRLRLWSAACATGEEAYTLALVLAEAELVPPAWDTRILATDVDARALARAEEGLYSAAAAAAVPAHLRRRYFEHPAGRRTDTLAVAAAIRRLVTFKTLNLADGRWPLHATFDVIFCRNVLIYFEPETQTRVIEGMLPRLAPRGLLVFGHADAVFWRVKGLVHLGNTMYAPGMGETG